MSYIVSYVHSQQYDVAILTPLQKRLYQYMFVDHYFPNMTQSERNFNLHHNRKLVLR